MNYICMLPEKNRFKYDKFDEYIKYCILKTDKPIDFDETLKIKGKLYTIWCGSAPSGDDRAFLVEEFEFKDEVSNEIETEITCPYCGYMKMDSWEQGDGEEEQCQICGSIFSWEKVITVDYRSEPVSKNENIKEILW